KVCGAGSVRRLQDQGTESRPTGRQVPSAPAPLPPGRGFPGQGCRRGSETGAEVLMLRWLINRRLNTEERTLGGSVAYARHSLGVSLRAFFKFLKILPLAEYRRKMPADAFHAARVVALQQDDCGECVQIAVNQARKAGVAPGLLQAVLAGRLDELP